MGLYNRLAGNRGNGLANEGGIDRFDQMPVDARCQTLAPVLILEPLAAINGARWADIRSVSPVNARCRD